MLSESLCQHQCEMHHADGDADLLIVKTTVQSARNKTTLLIGDETDLLILLLIQTNANTHDLYLIRGLSQRVTH